MAAMTLVSVSSALGSSRRSSFEKPFETFVLEDMDFGEHVDGSWTIELNFAPTCRDEVVEYIFDSKGSHVEVLELRRRSRLRAERLVARDTTLKLRRGEQVGDNELALSLQTIQRFRTFTRRLQKRDRVEIQIRLPKPATDQKLQLVDREL
jgi:hypothetical protein